MFIRILLLFLVSTNVFGSNNLDLKDKMKLSEIDSLLEEARAMKTTPGLKRGFVIKEISTGSIFQKLGLKSNDKVHSVNGKKVNNISEAMNEFNNVKTITVIRKNKEKLFKFDQK